jgi:hypothetical protein
MKDFGRNLFAKWDHHGRTQITCANHEKFQKLNKIVYLMPQNMGSTKSLLKNWIISKSFGAASLTKHFAINTQ